MLNIAVLFYPTPFSAPCKRYESEDDFIREMYERDPTERYDWLYGKVHDKIDKTATWLEQKDIGLLLQEFEPINDF